MTYGRWVSGVQRVGGLILMWLASSTALHHQSTETAIFGAAMFLASYLEKE